MIPVFNLEKLQSLLKDFYTMTHIRITVFDNHFHELVAYPEHLSAFCQLIRSDPKACEACMLSDQKACQIASRRKTPYTYVCHAGMTESITPLYMGNIVIGYLFFGQIFSYPSQQEGWDSIRKKCESYKIDMNFLMEVCRDRPLVSREYLEASSQIMLSVASYLCLERMVYIKNEDLPVKIDAYISEHFTENIDVTHICEKFMIGRTPLYEMTKQIYGTGLAEHIRYLRVEKAKQLLKENPDMRVSEIADACGFQDYNYFITVFKKITGMPPRKFREAAGQVTP